ncbi:MAG TPA: hypothetical protein VN039_04630 [Nitrospira sp.]|jgi:hypothetical protein|nr:hypothetical protein [Nitrospira sp.]
MRTIIRTSDNGNGKILAKGGGKQRTIASDPAKSNNWNHAIAAGTLASVLGLTWHPGIGHDSNESGTKHGFEF